MLVLLLIVFICSFLAFAISAICGGGAGLIMLPILGRLLPVAQVPAALSIGTFTSSASRLYVFRKNICWPIVRYFVPAALPAVGLGVLLLKFINPLYLEIAMGLFLIGNLPFVFRKKTEENDQTEKPGNFTLSMIGFSAGFLSGLTGAVGLLFNKFYMRYGLKKEEIVATRAANEIILHLIKIILYAIFGLISAKVIWIGAVVAIAAVVSSWTMKWILPFLSEFVFKKVGYIAMVLSGVVMLFQSVSAFAHDNQVNLSTSVDSNGVQAKIKWQKRGYAFEYKYDEGYEFERIIPFEKLTEEQKSYILERNKIADKIIVEEVYHKDGKSFEANYFYGNNQVDKINFD
ncbi:sulfite exporter TauE/SafE family protein [Chitinophaga flava]|uniref:Probable membrane transporter protein n=1 Tax=Chitinophaga flava TaxID=2259036 RepID=A0A365Y369_9BACT|nr:sulfite exporter TauE/SafE family protein [Chitinophaga flava]RBL92404.1 hypothetical protein DF182_07410 [Chitinophaga flava]